MSVKVVLVGTIMSCALRFCDKVRLCEAITSDGDGSGRCLLHSTLTVMADKGNETG